MRVLANRSPVRSGTSGAGVTGAPPWPLCGSAEGVVWVESELEHAVRISVVTVAITRAGIRRERVRGDIVDFLVKGHSFVPAGIDALWVWVAQISSGRPAP